MFQGQKDFLRVIANKDKFVINYFPRQMGKTYVINYLKKMGKLANQTAPTQPEGKDKV